MAFGQKYRESKKYIIKAGVCMEWSAGFGEHVETADKNNCIETLKFKDLPKKRFFLYQ